MLEINRNVHEEYGNRILDVPRESNNSPEQQTHHETFKTEAGPVDVQWKEFVPEQIEKSDSAILYLPGCALDAESGIVGEFTKEIANYGKAVSWAVSSRMEETGVADSQIYQAEAIRQLVEEKQIKEVTIVGHSQGGNKAIDLTYQMQKKNPEMNIRGLILIGAAGLYEQDPQELTKKFFKDAIVKTPKGATRSLFTQRSFVGPALRTGYDVAKGIAKEAIHAPLQFADRIKQESEDAAKRNERADEIEVPVVMVQGEMDPVSNYKEVSPRGTDDQSLVSQTERAKEIKNKLFKHSNNVTVLLAKKMGHHAVNYYRAETVAKTSLYMLERALRKNSDGS